MAVIGIVIVASPGDSFGQARDEGYMTTGQWTVHGRHRARSPKGASSVPLPRQKPAATKPPPGQQAQPLTRPEFTAAEEAVAQIPGMPDARFYADSIPDFQRALPAQPGAWLVLSTGGEEGAYGAGFLNGWLQSGTRPEFSVITGVSTASRRKRRACSPDGSHCSASRCSGPRSLD